MLQVQLPAQRSERALHRHLHTLLPHQVLEMHDWMSQEASWQGSRRGERLCERPDGLGGLFRKRKEGED